MADDEVGVRLSLKDRPKFSREAKAAADDVEKIGRAAERAERRSSGAFGAISRGVMGVAGTIVRAGGLIGAAMVAAGGAVVGMGLQTFIGMEQAQIGFETMLGSAENAQKFLGELEEFAKKTPFEFTGLVQSSQQLLAFGFAAEDILPMLTNIGDAAAALGAGEEGISRMTRAIGQMQAKGKVSAEEMMQLAELGVPAWDILAEKIGVSVPEAMELAQDGAIRAEDAVAGLVEGLGERFGGLMEKQSTTIGGLWSTLMDTIRMGSASVISPFQDQLRGVLERLIAYADSAATYLGDELPRAVDAFKWALAGGGFDDKLGGIAEAAGRVANMAYEVKTAWDEGGLHGVVSQFDETVGANGAITDAFESLRNIIEDVGTIVTDLLLPVLTDFADLLPGVNTPLEALESGLDLVADNASALKPIVVGLVAGWTAYKVVTLAVNAATAAGNAIRFIATASTAGLAAAQAGATTSTGALAAGTAILNTVMSMNPIALVVIALAALAAGLVYAWQNSETFRDVVTGAFNKVKEVVVGVWNWISENWPKIQGILTAPFDGARGLISAFWDSLKGLAVGAVNAIIKAWNALDIEVGPYSIPDWVPFVGGNTFHIKDVFPDVGYIGGGGGGPDRGARLPGSRGIPLAHDGATTASAGTVTIRPDEEIVVLPPAASVVPTATGERVPHVMRGLEKDDRPIQVQLVVDRKVLAEATFDHTRDKVARR